MIKYIFRRFLELLVALFLIATATFFLTAAAPGDPLVAYYGERTEKMSVEERERSLERLGLNDPIYVQYVRWVENAAQGDFGISYQYKQPVLEVLEGRMGNTLLRGLSKASVTLCAGRRFLPCAEQLNSDKEGEVNYEKACGTFTGSCPGGLYVPGVLLR